MAICHQFPKPDSGFSHITVSTLSKEIQAVFGEVTHKPLDVSEPKQRWHNILYSLHVKYSHRHPEEFCR